MKLRLYGIATLLFATMALLFASCKSDETTELGDIPVVTTDLFSVQTDAEQPNLIHFRFFGERMIPCWEIQRTETSTYTTSDREFSLAFPRKGTYRGTICAYGPGGLGEKLAFSFTVEAVAASESGKILTSTPWKIVKWGWAGDGWDYFGEPVPDYHKDDVLTFAEGGRFIYDPGEDARVYNDDEGAIAYAPSDGWSWELMDDGDRFTLQFGGGAFPGMQPNTAAIDALYDVTELTEQSIRLDYWQEAQGQYFVIFLAPVGTEPDPGPGPEPGPDPAPDFELTPLPADSPQIALLSAAVWKVGPLYGYNYGEEDLYDVSGACADDRISFLPDGKAVIDPGADGKIMNDGVGNQNFAPTGAESWILGTRTDGADNKLYLQFADGGFPLIKPNEPGTNLTYEVVELTGERLKLYWDMGDGGCFVTILERTGEEPDPNSPLEEQIALLTATVWKVGPQYGYNYGEEELYDIWGGAFDDWIAFLPDGKLVIDSGEDGKIMNDSIGDEEFSATGEERWSLAASDDRICMHFSGGGFPLLKQCSPGTDLTFEVVELTGESLKLYWDMGDGGCFVAILVPAGKEPEPGPVSPLEERIAWLKASPWKIVKWGWAGDGWDYFDDPLPDYHADDVLTFAEEGRFIYDPGTDARVYNDDEGAIAYTPSDDWSWELTETAGGYALQFGGGAFPGMQPNAEAVGGRYDVTELTPTSLRLDFWQEAQGQYFVIFLAPNN